MKWFRNASIGLKIFSSVLAVLIIAFGIIGIIIFMQVTDSLQQNIKESYQSTAQSNANLIAQQLETLKSTVAAIAARTDIRSMNFVIQKQILTREVRRIGCMRFSIADLQGNLTAITNQKTVNVSDRPYYQKALQGETSVADPSVSRVDNKLVMVVAAPIQDADGRVQGVLVAVYDGKMLSDLLGKVRVAAGKGSVYILNQEGTLIANPQMFGEVLKQSNIIKQSETNPQMKVMADFQRKMIAGETGFGAYLYGGVTKFIAYEPVPGTDWSLAVTAPRDVVFGRVDALSWQIPILFVLALAFVSLIVFWVSRAYVSRPIAGLVASAEQLAVGDVNVNIHDVSHDEVGRLAQSFQKMIANIREQAKMAERIAAGDLTVAIDPKSAADIQANSMKQMITTLRELIAETGQLNQAAAAGQLSVRGNESKFQGGFAEIVRGMNQTMDAVVEPLTEAGQVLAKMAVNDYTAEVIGSYQGMLGEFTQQINTVRTRLLSVQDAFVRLGKGDTSRLEEFLKAGKRSENDQMMPSAIAMMQAIRNLIREAGVLATAAAKGNLDVRSDAAQFEGGYHDIINGFNTALDAIATPLREAADVLQEMAKGDLRVAMQGEYEGSYAVIKRSLNQTIHAFNEILGSISVAADQVAAGSKQLSEGSQALSQGATEQASSLEELTSAVTEIAAQTKQNAMDANHANDLAKKAWENAEQGNTRMAEMLKSMDGINESSASISKIIKVIDEIAFQTNILALNAAVEAARAGQYGKGFAVVAEEVRNLAARSADAAKETTLLIEGSIKKVESGAHIADETAHALQKIVSGVSEAAQLVADIAAASNEQATGIAQVNQGIEQVSEVVQTNTATSEESASASEELSSQAGLLKEMVNRFKLNAHHSEFLVNGNAELNIAEKMAPMSPRLQSAAGRRFADNHALTNDFGKY